MNDTRSEKKRKVGDDDLNAKKTAVVKSFDDSTSIFNWFNTNEWRNLMLRSKPAMEVFQQLTDFDMADKYTLEMISSPFNVPLTKSKHAAEQLPRPYLFRVIPQACPDKWWSTLFEEGFVKESPHILRDRRFIVKSHIIGMFSFSGSSFGQLRVDDFYYPEFWLEVNIDMRNKTVRTIRGRHAEATSFHIKYNPFPNMVFDPIGVTKRPIFRGHISANNVLSVWDEESEYSAFEVICDLTKFFKICNETN